MEKIWKVIYIYIYRERERETEVVCMDDDIVRSDIFVVLSIETTEKACCRSDITSFAY
jgi:hypothetical protein